MKVVSAKDLKNVMDAMRMVEADEYYAGCTAESKLDQYTHLSAATAYQVVRMKLENLPVFEV